MSTDANVGRRAVYDVMVAEEFDFVSKTKIFVDRFIVPVYVRDTTFKRALLNESTVAVCFNTMMEIYESSCCLLDELRKCSTPSQVADAFSHFAPSLTLFATFVSETASTLNVLKKLSKQLLAFLTEDLKDPTFYVEDFIINPTVHFERYENLFSQYVSLTSSDDADYVRLNVALDEIRDAKEYADSKFKEEEEKVRLLELQNSCEYYIFVLQAIVLLTYLYLFL